jgi:hypothetical protein
VEPREGSVALAEVLAVLPVAMLAPIPFHT